MSNNVADVTVLLPVYNGEFYLRDAVASVLGQTYTNFVLLAINDGSTDGSGAVLHEFARQDSRVIVVQRENKGLAATLNEGIARAQTPYIARMDHDDICLPQRLALQVQRLKNDSELAVLGGQVRLTDASGREVAAAPLPVGKKAVAAALDDDCHIAHPTVMARREALLAVGGYDTRFFCEDYELWLRMRDAGYAVDNLAETVLLYRDHDAKMSGRRNALRVALAVAAAKELSCRRRENRPLDPALLPAIQDVATCLSIFGASPDADRFPLTLLETLLSRVPDFTPEEAEAALLLARRGVTMRQAARLAVRCIRGRRWGVLKALPKRLMDAGG